MLDFEDGADLESYDSFLKKWVKRKNSVKAGSYEFLHDPLSKHLDQA